MSSSDHKVDPTMKPLRVMPVSLDAAEEDDDILSYEPIRIGPLVTSFGDVENEVTLSLNGLPGVLKDVEVESLLRTYCFALETSHSGAWKKCLSTRNVTLFAIELPFEANYIRTIDMLKSEQIQGYLQDKCPTEDLEWFKEVVEKKKPVMLAFLFADRSNSLLCIPLLIQDSSICPTSTGRRISLRYSPYSVDDHTEALREEGGELPLMGVSCVLVPGECASAESAALPITIYSLSSYARSRIQVSLSYDKFGLLGFFPKLETRLPDWYIRPLCAPSKQMRLPTVMQEPGEQHQYLEEDFATPLGANKLLLTELITMMIMALNNVYCPPSSLFPSLEVHHISDLWLPDVLDYNTGMDGQRNPNSSMKYTIVELLRNIDTFKMLRRSMTSLLSTVKTEAFNYYVCKLIELQIMDFTTYLETLQGSVNDGTLVLLIRLTTNVQFKSYVDVIHYFCDSWVPILKDANDEELQSLLISELHPLQQLRPDAFSELMQLKYGWLMTLNRKMKERLANRLQSVILMPVSSSIDNRKGCLLPKSCATADLIILDEISLLLRIIDLYTRSTSQSNDTIGINLHKANGHIAGLLGALSDDKDVNLRQTVASASTKCWSEELAMGRSRIWDMFHVCLMKNGLSQLVYLIRQVLLEPSFLYSALTNIGMSSDVSWLLSMSGATVEVLHSHDLLAAFQTELKSKFPSSHDLIIDITKDEDNELLTLKHPDHSWSLQFYSTQCTGKLHADELDTIKIKNMCRFTREGPRPVNLRDRSAMSNSISRSYSESNRSCLLNDRIGIPKLHLTGFTSSTTERCDCYYNAPRSREQTDENNGGSSLVSSRKSAGKVVMRARVVDASNLFEFCFPDEVLGVYATIWRMNFQCGMLKAACNNLARHGKGSDMRQGYVIMIVLGLIDSLKQRSSSGMSFAMQSMEKMIQSMPLVDGPSFMDELGRSIEVLVFMTKIGDLSYLNTLNVLLTSIQLILSTSELLLNSGRYEEWSSYLDEFGYRIQTLADLFKPTTSQYSHKSDTDLAIVMMARKLDHECCCKLEDAIFSLHQLYRGEEAT